MCGPPPSLEPMALRRPELPSTASGAKGVRIRCVFRTELRDPGPRMLTHFAELLVDMAARRPDESLFTFIYGEGDEHTGKRRRAVHRDARISPGHCASAACARAISCRSSSTTATISSLLSGVPSISAPYRRSSRTCRATRARRTTSSTCGGWCASPAHPTSSPCASSRRRSRAVSPTQAAA